MREKKIAIIIIMCIWGAGKHIQSVKESESIFMGFYCPFFPSTKQSSLMEIIFSRVGFTVQLTVSVPAPLLWKMCKLTLAATKKTLLGWIQNGDVQREYNELKNCLLININTIKHDELN